MENNNQLYGISAVKVKLVDSRIWKPFILIWIRPRKRWQDRFDTWASFIMNNSFSNFFTFIDALCNKVLLLIWLTFY